VSSPKIVNTGWALGYTEQKIIGRAFWIPVPAFDSLLHYGNDVLVWWMLWGLKIGLLRQQDPPPLVKRRMDVDLFMWMRFILLGGWVRRTQGPKFERKLISKRLLFSCSSLRGTCLTFSPTLIGWRPLSNESWRWVGKAAGVYSLLTSYRPWSISRVIFPLLLLSILSSSCDSSSVDLVSASKTIFLRFIWFAFILHLRWQPCELW